MPVGYLAVIDAAAGALAGHPIDVLSLSNSLIHFYFPHERHFECFINMLAQCEENLPQDDGHVSPGNPTVVEGLLDLVEDRSLHVLVKHVLVRLLHVADWGNGTPEH